MPFTIESKRDAAVALAISLNNTPYIWGGNDPLQDEGVDCSGMLRHIFDDLRMIPPGSDFPSWKFAQMYPEVKTLERGVLVFWLRGPKIGHVEMVVGKMEGEWWTIGASGGGRTTNTVEAAEEKDARVKVHPVPPNWVKAVDPFAAEEA